VRKPKSWLDALPYTIPSLDEPLRRATMFFGMPAQLKRANG
jgi:hypothetical protein